MKEVWLVTDFYDDIFVYDSFEKGMNALNEKVDEAFEQMTFYSKYYKRTSKQDFACQNFNIERKDVL